MSSAGCNDWLRRRTPDPNSRPESLRLHNVPITISNVWFFIHPDRDLSP